MRQVGRASCGAFVCEVLSSTSDHIWLADCTKRVVRIGKCIIVLVLFAGTANAAAAHRQHPYRKHWRQSVVGKKAVGRVVGAAALGQATNRPRKYGTGAAG